MEGVLIMPLTDEAVDDTSVRFRSMMRVDNPALVFAWATLLYSVPIAGTVAWLFTVSRSLRWVQDNRA